MTKQYPDDVNADVRREDIFTKEQAEEAVAALQSEYGDEYELREDYSGRGMYGAVCYGITGPSAETIHEALVAAGFTRLSRLRLDSMGRGVIVY